MKKDVYFRMAGLLLGGLLFWSCNQVPFGSVEDRNVKNEPLNVKTRENEALNVKIIKPDQEERDELLINSFLRCVDIAVSHVRYWPKGSNEYNYLDEPYFRSREPVFLAHKRYTKTRYEYRIFREYDPYGGGYDIHRRVPVPYSYYKEGFVPKSELDVQNGSESHGRVSYEEVLRNFFTGDYFGIPYIPTIEKNQKATRYLYNIFRKLYHVDDFAHADFDINPSFGFGTIWKQDGRGRVIYIPLNEIREAHPSYTDNLPNIDLTRFDDYFKTLSWKEKEPVKHYYLYLKYQEMNPDAKYSAMH